jgi:hypothetical protein
MQRPLKASRSVHRDLPGKLVTKTLLMNQPAYSNESIHIPLGRYGDADSKYGTHGEFLLDLRDGYVESLRAGLPSHNHGVRSLARFVFAQ